MRGIVTCNVIGMAVLAITCGAANAGSGNTITIEQKNTSGFGPGNSLTVDQAGANNSVVGGALYVEGSNTLTLTDTAQQIGSGNMATLKIKDDDGATAGKIGLMQDNSVAGALGVNDAVISVLGGGTGLVSQIGGNNTANLSVTGLNAKGSIYQRGNDNQAGLSVSGTDAGGSITQNGDNNHDINLLVSGTGTQASYTLNGNNLTSITGSGVQVISNGATVTITQTAF